MSSLLVYGSYGYVGRLIAEEAVDRGLDVVLGGRDRAALLEQVADLDRPAIRFDPDNAPAVRDGVSDVDCVLNCAGPFSETAAPIVEACLQTGTDYVDVTGEIPVVERLHGWDEIASDRGVVVLPSAAFSSIPMGCLAVHLAEQLPDAEYVALGVDSLRPPSGGSIETVLEGIETGGTVRQQGRLEHVPAAWRTRRIDFGRGSRTAVTMPLGEVSTAHYATGIPNVEVYVVVPGPTRFVLRAHRYLAPVVSQPPVRWTLQRLAGVVRDGPSDRARERGAAYVWGEVRSDGDRAVSRLRTPDPYDVTVDGATTVAERVLDGDADDGFQTVPDAFGPEFVFELDDVEGFFDEETVPEVPTPT